jgi:hypothetical protein
MYSGDAYRLVDGLTQVAPTMYDMGLPLLNVARHTHSHTTISFALSSEVTMLGLGLQIRLKLDWPVTLAMIDSGGTRLDCIFARKATMPSELCLWHLSSHRTLFDRARSMV